jgi:hypothetical protein
MKTAASINRLGLPLSTIYYRARQLGIARTEGVWIFTPGQARRIVAFKGAKRGRKRGKRG